MSSKKNKIYLAVVFIVLLGLVLFFKLTNTYKQNSNYKSLLVSFLPEDVSSIEIISKNEPEKVLKITKSGNVWQLQKEDKSFTGDTAIISQMLQNINNLKANYVASTNIDDHAKYQLTDTNATRIILKGVDKTIADLYIGKFDYIQPDNPYDRQGKMISYVRLADDNTVYAVDGFLRMNINADINTYRNHNLFYNTDVDLTKISFNYPGDSSFVLAKKDNKWYVNDSLADSNKVNSYLSRLKYLSSSYFMEEPVARKQPSYSVLIEGNNMPSSVKIDAFPADTINKYYINSSFNPEAYFSGEKNKVFESIFKRKEYFK
ncbi:MAG: hypothetical protein Kow0068_06860 [Marinilabiliales bacterium]